MKNDEKGWKGTAWIGNCVRCGGTMGALFMKNGGND